MSLPVHAAGRKTTAKSYLEGIERNLLPVLDYFKPDVIPDYEPWDKSLRYTLTKSWYNILLVVIPIIPAWIAHFYADLIGQEVAFGLNFIAMVPLQKVFDWCGENLSLFLQPAHQDLLIITLSNAVEATLAIILLVRCRLRLLQSTVIGVVLLHLLLVPGTAFFVQGALRYEQKIDPKFNNLTHSLLMIGVLAIVVPTAFFAALDNGPEIYGSKSPHTQWLPPTFQPLVGDGSRLDILRMSRGISIMLLAIYVVSRLYRHHILHHHQDSNDKTDVSNSQSGPSMTSNSPLPNSQSLSELQVPTTASNKPPKKLVKPVNPWVCGLILLVTVGLMGPTAEFLVDDVEKTLHNNDRAKTEWFGLIFLPIVSFSGDAIVVIFQFSKEIYDQIRHDKESKKKNASGSTDSTPSGSEPRPRLASVQEKPPPQDQGQDQESEPGPEWVSKIAHSRPIDLSIQFTLWWMPLLVLLSWCMDKPLHLLFDVYEVIILLGACFLVNSVMVDSKTNISEGLTMISFYAMIATATWFYPGQPQVALMLTCPGSVAQGIARRPPHSV